MKTYISLLGLACLSLIAGDRAVAQNAGIKDLLENHMEEMRAAEATLGQIRKTMDHCPLKGRYPAFIWNLQQALYDNGKITKKHVGSANIELSELQVKVDEVDLQKGASAAFKKDILTPFEQTIGGIVARNQQGQVEKNERGEPKMMTKGIVRELKEDKAQYEEIVKGVTSEGGKLSQEVNELVSKKDAPEACKMLRSSLQEFHDVHMSLVGDGKKQGTFMQMSDYFIEKLQGVRAVGAKLPQ